MGISFKNNNNYNHVIIDSKITQFELNEFFFKNREMMKKVQILEFKCDFDNDLDFRCKFQNLRNIFLPEGYNGDNIKVSKNLNGLKSPNTKKIPIYSGGEFVINLC